MVCRPMLDTHFIEETNKTSNIIILHNGGRLHYMYCLVIQVVIER